jgi:hypothetical protein
VWGLVACCTFANLPFKFSNLIEFVTAASKPNLSQIFDSKVIRNFNADEVTFLGYFTKKEKISKSDFDDFYVCKGSNTK